MPIVKLWQDQSHGLELEVVRRRNPNSRSSWDGNWLKMRVLVATGGETTEYVADVQVWDLKEFLAGLYDGPYEGEEVFSFQTLEGGIEIFVEELSQAEYKVEYTASPNGDSRGPHIVSELRVSRAALDEAARQLELTLMVFPEVCGPDATEPRASIAPSVN